MKIKNLAELRQIGKVKIFDEIDFEVETRKNLVFYLDKGLVNRDIDLYSGEEFLLSAKSSKKGQVKGGDAGWNPAARHAGGQGG